MRDDFVSRNLSIIVWALFGVLVVCIPIAAFQEKPDPGPEPPPTYIEGVVKEKNYKHGYLADSWTASLSLGESYRLVESAGCYSASKMDALVGNGDKIKIRLSKHQTPEDSSYSIVYDQIVEVNGIKIER